MNAGRGLNGSPLEILETFLTDTQDTQIWEIGKNKSWLRPRDHLISLSYIA